MKRLMALTVALSLSLALLAGCGGAKTEKPAAPATEQKAAAPAPAPAAPTPKKPDLLTVGFVPSQDAAGIESKVKPMEDYLSKALGMPVKTFVGTNFVGVIEAMGSGKVDVGWLNPLGYVMASGDYGAKVLLKSVRKGSATYRAQLTVRAEDNIPVCDLAKDPKCAATFNALKGKKLAFVDAASTSGYLFPASFMKGAGVDIEKGKFFTDVIQAGQHDAAAKLVYNKGADASWTFEDVRDNLLKELPDVKTKLIPVAYTNPIPNDTVSVRKDLPADFVDQIKKALLDFSQTEEGKKVLKDLYTIDGLVEGNDADYNVVRDMAKNMGVDIKGELSKTKK
ncbi:MAG TPA: phosphate/phosphite/phosphonate ABC transporter substrate-binding protein [Symbiobacteriaceae bacterium]|nr:phosphate/phosphite/phosphonate ABC transporter substrate-binding protein [Symbiobacteriaceae bacterium]